MELVTKEYEITLFCWYRGGKLFFFLHFQARRNRYHLKLKASITNIIDVTIFGYGPGVQFCRE